MTGGRARYVIPGSNPIRPKGVAMLGGRKPIASRSQTASHERKAGVESKRRQVAIFPPDLVRRLRSVGSRRFEFKVTKDHVLLNLPLFSPTNRLQSNHHYRVDAGMSSSRAFPGSLRVNTNKNHRLR